jgi:selenoprotein W-related protein
LTAKLLERFKQTIEGLELQPSSGGCFEVTVDGELVYSKLKTGSFPDEDKLVNQIAKRR